MKKYTINETNLNFILEITNSTIKDAIKWLKLIKKRHSDEEYPCIQSERKYLDKYSFYDKNDGEDGEEKIKDFNRIETDGSKYLESYLTEKNMKIYVGSIINECEDNYTLWNEIRKNDDLFNELILALKVFK